MSLNFDHQKKLDESGMTDNAEDRSCEGNGAGTWSVDDFSLDFPAYLRTQPETSVKSEFYDTAAARENSPASGQVTPKEHYQPSEQFEQQYKHGWSNSMYELSSISDDTTRLSLGKGWPSLQIVCPDSPLYASNQGHDIADSPSMQSRFITSESGDKVQGSGMFGAYTGARQMLYYPSTNAGALLEEGPANYQKMRPSSGFAYSPAPHASPAGYRPNLYGMPLTPRGGMMTQASPVRSPAVNRRFMEPIDGYIYQVQFKRAHKNFILAPSAPRNIIPGDFVKVEADRGEDMGIVLSKSPANEFEEVIPTAGYRGRGFSSGQGERKFLFRLANADERTALVTKVQDEERALEVIRGKVMEQLLPMTILDAEYQFDRHKLTFFFEADRRIDFRELVSELFSLYKTRIWMQQVDTSVLGMSDAGAELAKATGFLPERDDHAYLQTTSHMRRLDGSAGSGMGVRGMGGGGMRSHEAPLAYQHQPEPPLQPFHAAHVTQSQRMTPPAVHPQSLSMQVPAGHDWGHVRPPDEQHRPLFQPRGEHFAPPLELDGRAHAAPPARSVSRLPMAAQPMNMSLGLEMGMGTGMRSGGCESGSGGGPSASVGGLGPPSGAMRNFFSLSPLQGSIAPSPWPFSPQQPNPLLCAPHPQIHPQPQAPFQLPPQRQQQHRFSPYAAPFRPSSELQSAQRAEGPALLADRKQGGDRGREEEGGKAGAGDRQHDSSPQARDFVLEMGLQRLTMDRESGNEESRLGEREWGEGEYQDPVCDTFSA